MMAVVAVVVNHSLQVSNVSGVLLVITITRDALRVHATDKVHLVITVTQRMVSVNVKRTSQEHSVIFVSQVSMVFLIVRSAVVILLVYDHCLEDHWETAARQTRYVLAIVMNCTKIL